MGFLALLAVSGPDVDSLAPFEALPGQGLLLPSEFRGRRPVISHLYWQFLMI